MKKYNHIIIDGNNLFWRSFTSSLKKYVSVEDFHLFSGAIYDVLDRIKQIKENFAYESSIIYFCFDNPESVLNLRKFLDNNYKSHRFKKNAPKGLYKTLNIFVEILKVYDDNYRILNVDSLEADDLTYSIISEIKENLSRTNRCLVISNDLDWSRNLSLSDFCYWWNFLKMYNRKAFESEFGFYPIGNKIQLYKSIHGDSSDNIKNAVPYLPKDILNDILNKFDNVEDMLSGIWDQDYPLKWKKKIKEAEIDIKANNNLVDFIDANVSLKDYMLICKRNIKKLKIFYDSLDLKYESFMYTKEEKKQKSKEMMFGKKK